MHRSRIEQALGRFPEDDHVDPRRPRIGQTLWRVRIGFHRAHPGKEAIAIPEPQMRADLGAVCVAHRRQTDRAKKNRIRLARAFFAPGFDVLPCLLEIPRPGANLNCNVEALVSVRIPSTISPMKLRGKQGPPNLMQTDGSLELPQISWQGPGWGVMTQTFTLGPLPTDREPPWPYPSGGYSCNRLTKTESYPIYLEPNLPP